MSFRSLSMLTALPVLLASSFACETDTKPETVEVVPSTEPGQADANGMPAGANAEAQALKPNGAPSDNPALAAAVKDALFKDPETTAKQITVQVVDGEVKLSGFVDSWAEKMAAGRVARAVGNVQSVDNNLTVGHTDDELGDGPIAVRVKAALFSDPWTTGKKINVAALQGVVQLSGVVSSADEKQRAAEIAESILGVTDVQNKLEVQAP